MEWVEVIERASEFIRLRYYPEQTSAIGEYGEVVYFFASDTWNFNKPASDYPMSYAMHACNFVRQRFKAGEEIPDGDIIAWY